MKPNSNTNITNFSVDPITQQITSLEVNGEVVETGGADLDDNKAVSIDVSTYSGTVEVNPTSGKDGMKKVSIDLTNIPLPTGWTYVYHNGNSNGSDHEMYIISSVEIPENPQEGDLWQSGENGVIYIRVFDNYFEYVEYYPWEYNNDGYWYQSSSESTIWVDDLELYEHI